MKKLVLLLVFLNGFSFGMDRGREEHLSGYVDLTQLRRAYSEPELAQAELERLGVLEDESTDPVGKTLDHARTILRLTKRIAAQTVGSVDRERKIREHLLLLRIQVVEIKALFTITQAEARRAATDVADIREKTSTIKQLIEDMTDARYAARCQTIGTVCVAFIGVALPTVFAWLKTQLAGE